MRLATVSRNFVISSMASRTSEIAGKDLHLLISSRRASCTAPILGRIAAIAQTMIATKSGSALPLGKAQSCAYDRT